MMYMRSPFEIYCVFQSTEAVLEKAIHPLNAEYN